MPTRLMDLRHVPDDEADEIRLLLEQHDVPYFETPASRFGVSAGAIWLRDDSRREQALTLLESYQQQRRDGAREAFAQARSEGRATTFLHLLRHEPLRVISALIVIVVLIALCALPYFLLRGR